ncbi:FecCD family ABC transporter permease [Glutamicibacter sp. X7]
MISIALLSVLGSVFFGDYRVSFGDLIATLGGDPPAAQTEFFVLHRRLPRALVALLAGMLLAASGALIQQLLRNPLASPDIIGLTSGASLGGCVVLVAFSGTLAQASLGAFLGAGLALAVLLVARRFFNVTGAKMVLLGVGLAALSQSLTSYLLTVEFVPSAQVAQTWLVGTLQGRGWAEVPWLGAGVLLLLWVHLFDSKALDMLNLGDDVAAGLGVPVIHLRVRLLCVATICAAVAVLCAGPIGFVALVAPHIARQLTGRTQLFACALTGGLLLVISDLVAQYALGFIVPVGVVTIVLGGGFFLWLLFRQGVIRD